jgi:hypothetical protein
MIGDDNLTNFQLLLLPFLLATTHSFGLLRPDDYLHRPVYVNSVYVSLQLPMPWYVTHAVKRCVIFRQGGGLQNRSLPLHIRIASRHRIRPADQREFCRIYRRADHGYCESAMNNSTHKDQSQRSAKGIFLTSWRSVPTTSS